MKSVRKDARQATMIAKDNQYDFITLITEPQRMELYGERTNCVLDSTPEYDPRHVKLKVASFCNNSSTDGDNYDEQCQ